MLRRVLSFVLAAIAGGFVGASALAGPEPFFKGKTITIVTSTGPGGTYDLLARMVARRMSQFIPGAPGVIVENMPGAGNLLATNYLFNIAPKDGTTIGTIHAAMPLDQVLDGRGVRFDAARFNWIGSSGSENEVIIVWHTAGVKTFEDARRRAVVLGTTGTGSGLSIIPQAMNNVLGTQFKLVIGYKSSEDINLAMERGEVQARAFSMGSIVAQHAEWIQNKTVYFIAQAGAKREADLPDTPLLTELATTPEQRGVLQLISSPAAFGHPFVAPPGVPPERVAVLRRAFLAVLRDPGFQQEARKLQMTVDPTTGDELANLARSVVDASPSVVSKAKAAIAPLETTAGSSKKRF